MEEIHKKVLIAKMSKIIYRISSPGTLASCLVVLTPQDKERIECKTTNNGPIHGATELVSRLMKRGSNAFNCFLEMLDDQDYGDLATELRNEVVKAEKQSMRNQRPYHSTPAPSHSSSLDEGPVTDGGEDDPFQRPRANTGPSSCLHPPLVKQAHTHGPELDPRDWLSQQPMYNGYLHPGDSASNAAVTTRLPHGTVADVAPSAGRQVQQNVMFPVHVPAHRFPGHSAVPRQSVGSTVYGPRAMTQKQVRPNVPPQQFYQDQYRRQGPAMPFPSQDPNALPLPAQATQPSNEHLHSMRYPPHGAYPTFGNPQSHQQFAGCVDQTYIFQTAERQDVPSLGEKGEDEIMPIQGAKASTAEKSSHGAYPNYPSHLSQVAACVNQEEEVQETPTQSVKSKPKIAPMQRAQPSTADKSSPVHSGNKSAATEPSPKEPVVSLENALPVMQEDNEEQKTDRKPHASGVDATEANSTDKLLKEIPVSVKNKVVKMLNHKNGHTWKDVAGPMGLSVAELDELDNDTDKGKMEGLFILMIQRQRRVSDLVWWLNHEDVQRLDVIEVFRSSGLIPPALERELTKAAPVAEVDESPVKPPTPCTEEKLPVVVGTPIVCSEERLTDANHTTPQTEIKKYNEQQISSPYVKTRAGVVAKGASFESSAGKKTIPSNADVAEGGTLTSEKPKQCTEAKVSRDDETRSDIEKTKISKLERKENTLSDKLCSPAGCSVKDDLDEGDVPTQCMESKSLMPLASAEDGISPAQCTSLNATPATEAKSSCLKSTTSVPVKTNDPGVVDGSMSAQCSSLSVTLSMKKDSSAKNAASGVESIMPSQCTSLGATSSMKEDSSAKNAGSGVKSIMPSQCTSLDVTSLIKKDSSAKNAASGEESIMPSQCTSLGATSSKKKDSSAKNAARGEENIMLSQCTSLDVASSMKKDSSAKNAASGVESIMPSQCTSLDVASSMKKDSSAKNAASGEESIMPSQCISLDVESSMKKDSSAKNAASGVESIMPSQCTSLGVTSSVKEEASAKGKAGVAEGNTPTECTSLGVKPSTKEDSSVKNAAGVVKGNTPSQCTSLGVTSSTKENYSAKNAVSVIESKLPTECSSIQIANVKKSNAPTQCSSLNTTTLSNSSERKSYTPQDNSPTECTVESLFPTQCDSSFCVGTSSTPVKEATVTATFSEDSYAEYIASSSKNVSSYGTETQVNQTEKAPSDSHDSPVACTDIESSKEDECRGIAFEEQGKAGDVDNNELSCLPYGVDDEDGDVFCSDEFGRCVLIVCCENYESLTPLDGLSHQAKELSEPLKEAGWQVTSHFDCSAMTMQAAVEDFLNKVGGGRSKVCIVYLIGHTVQIQGDNHLLPVDVTTDLSRADVLHMALNISGLLTLLEEKSYLHVTFVDGAHENQQPLKCYGVFPGLAGVKTPPKCTVAFPCSPGAVRPSNERLTYIQSVTDQLRIPGLTLRELLTNVATTMTCPESRCSSPPCDMSLAQSLAPFAIITRGEESGVTAGPVGIQVPPRPTPKHALIISNRRYENNSLLTSVYEDAQRLKHALDKAQWKVTDTCDRSTEDMIKEVRKFLSGVKGERRIVMVYFIGFAQEIKGSNFLFGTDWPASNESEASRYAITTQWILDLLCEHVSGPRILVVDDMNTSDPEGLASLTVPHETLVSLPCAREVRCHSDEDERNSFSLQSILFSTIGSLMSLLAWTPLKNKSPELSYSLALAQRLEANPRGSLKEILSKSSLKGHRVEENLFFV